MSCCSTNRPTTWISKLCAPSRMPWWPSRAAPWSFRTIAGSSIASQHISSPSKVTPKWSGSKATIRSMLRTTGNAKAKMRLSRIEYATSHSQGETQMYITPQDELHVEYQGIALTCPHCQTLTHLTPIAVPKFEELSRRKPKHIGIVFRCDTCIEPIFLKFAVKAYTALRVELASNFMEIERAREHFPLTYLPEEAEGLFKEALNCYSAACFNAFGSMSRRTAQSLFRELGERGKLELFDTLQEIRSLADLDDETFSVLRAVLFGSDSDPWPNQPNLSSEHAGILLEVMRDLLYQTFVRKARLIQAVTFRRFVAPQGEA